MSRINWETFYNCEDVELKNSIFVEKIMEVLDSECPLKKYQCRNKFRNWVNPEVKELMMNRDKMKEQARATGRLDDWNTFKKLRNLVVKKLRSSKIEFFNKLYTKADKEKTTKSLFNITKELQGKKIGNTPQTFIKDGKPIRKPLELANFQMNYYVEKLRNISALLPVSFRNPYRILDAALERWEGTVNLNEFSFRDVTLVETAKFIAALSDSTAFGHDKMDSIAIKSAFDSVNPSHAISNQLVTEENRNLRENGNLQN